MFTEEYDAVSGAAKTKSDLLKRNPLGYFLLSLLAGMFIGFGVLLAFTAGGYLNGSPWTKIVMGCAFGVALSLVVIAGAELFTGNNLVMTAGVLKKRVRLTDTLKVWIVCYIGNWIGAVILALIYHYTGLGSGAIGEFMASGAVAKMTAGFVPLLMRGILCNMLVCLAVWCSFRCKTEAGKLIMVFWCLFAFFTTGFEHSIANMTLLTVALLEPLGAEVTVGGYFYNILTVTLGNMIGGIVFAAIPYFIASLKNKSK